MEELVKELEKIIRFKDDTREGDVVLIVTENPRSFIYAMVQGFERDATRRDEWWRVSLLFLTVPPQLAEWTLRREQFTGQEVFTMGGDKRFVKAVDLSAVQPPSPGTPPEETGRKRPKPELKLVK